MSTQHAAERPTTEPWPVLGGVLLAAVYVWTIAWLLLATVVPALVLGWQPVVITSGSMEPLIRPGDVVLSAAGDAVAPGQVVTFEDPARAGSLTTHRVAAIADDGSLRTQGDANARPDSTLVPREAVVGSGRLLVPMIGLPLVWITQSGVHFAAWLVLTAVAASVLLDRARRPRARPRARIRSPWRRLHDAVYRGHRADAGRLRRLAPSATVVLLGLAVARSAGTVTLTVVVLVLVVLFDPDGPQLRVARLQRAGAALAVFVVAAGPAVGRSSAAFTDEAATASSSFLATGAFPFAGLQLWLGNDPEGVDTLAAAVQPLRTVRPTAATLPNYATDRDDLPGLLVKKGGASVFEADPKKIQRWTHAPGEDLTLTSAQLVFHSAVKDLQPARAATVHWFLRHCDPAGLDCVELADRAVADADWQLGQDGFVERTLGLGALAHTVPTGRVLELAVTVPDADDDHWLAYGTTAQASRLELGVATPGVCPGAGSSTQHVVTDTWIEEADPTRGFGADNELRVQSEVGRNERSLLTVALPVIPQGCTLTGATLHVTTKDSTLGRSLVVQRTDTVVDAATVTWATQPTTSGAVAMTASAENGPTALDATAPVAELYALGNTGLQLRDAVEDAPGTERNRFHSADGRPYPDTEGPRLEITWGP